MAVTAGAPVRVLLADDEALMRSGLRLMLGGEDGLEIVAEAADGAEAVELTTRLRPDVVLMDIRMPGVDGLAATRAIVEAGLDAHIVLLTAFDTDTYLLEGLRAGAVSFLLKDSRPDAVIEAVRRAAAGQSDFSPAVLKRLIRLADAPATGESRRLPAVGPAGLTARERDVGELVAQGLTNAEIAAGLEVSLATVKTHLGNLFDKLHVTNRVQLALRFLERDQTGNG
ncbi:response regulator transcription factor [Nocardioides sp. GXZ039]|uniref:response regulator transcription factor n=1 Tax=Nocardioides sp. GXZ039 TaxID=3136018 RepID=UPI0030F42130